jgi:hypothetical protein
MAVENGVINCTLDVQHDHTQATVAHDLGQTTSQRVADGGNVKIYSDTVKTR